MQRGQCSRRPPQEWDRLEPVGLSSNLAHRQLGFQPIPRWKCRMKICFGGEETSWLIVEVVVEDKDMSLEGASCFHDRGVYFLLKVVFYESKDHAGRKVRLKVEYEGAGMQSFSFHDLIPAKGEAW